MEDQTIYTLAECVDEYLAQRFISKKKYFSAYMIIAKNYWKKIFKNTIYAVNSEWKPLKKGVPYNYIDKPQGLVRLFSVAQTNECGEIVPLFYNNTINIISKPTEKKCSCDKCDCSGLCDDINSMVYTTKLLFTDNGAEYYEKKWVKPCPNGDIIEYREVPTKKYNSFEGDTSPSDYTIVTEVFQETICKLKTKVCGCPEDTIENCELINTFCGAFLPINACCRKKDCDNFLGEINNNGKGSIKFSECGTKIYFIPHDKTKKLPDYLLVNWQTSGENCSDVVQVPDYAIETMFSGIHFYSIRFNSSYSINEKNEAKWAANAGENDLIMYLNPLSLKTLSTIQNAEIKW